MELLIAAATSEQVKWTDAVTAVSSLFQAVFIGGGILVALAQLDQIRKAERVKVFNDVSAMLEEHTLANASMRLSTSFDPRDDIERIRQLLERDEGDIERLQCEQDIVLVTNAYNTIWSTYSRSLIDKELFLEQYDEWTLFLCHALRGGYELYDLADYSGLIFLARRCRDNYVLANGPNPNLLEIPIAAIPPARFRRNRTTLNRT
jgi:hypothetical protein